MWIASIATTIMYKKIATQFKISHSVLKCAKTWNLGKSHNIILFFWLFHLIQMILCTCLLVIEFLWPQHGEGMVQTNWKVLPYMYGIFFRFCHIESLGYLKKIPTWYLPIMFFSKNWNQYSKSHIMVLTWENEKNFA